MLCLLCYAAVLMKFYYSQCYAHAQDLCFNSSYVYCYIVSVLLEYIDASQTTSNYYAGMLLVPSYYAGPNLLIYWKLPKGKL